MIEIPEALTADTIATEAEFFSFGTNDLTQMTRNFPETISGKFLKIIGKKILTEDPFRSVDQVGVGKLMKMSVELGRERPTRFTHRICGEQGGDPEQLILPQDRTQLCFLLAIPGAIAIVAQHKRQ